MTFNDLQDALVSEVEDILSDVQSNNTDDEMVVGITGYAHRLPLTQSAEDDPAQFFPYFIVRIDNGKTADDDDCWHVAVNILLGVYESDVSSMAEESAPLTIVPAGHEQILIMIQRIVNRFVNDPGLVRMYRADQDIDWAVGDDDTYPFYFGAVGITFSVPKLGRRKYDV